MNSKTNGMKNKDIHMKYNPNQIYNISNSPVNQSSYIHHQKQYSDYQVISPSQNKNEKIISNLENTFSFFKYSFDLEK